MRKWLKKLLRDVKGNVAVTFALGAVAITAVGGGAVDYMSKSKTHANLQSLADAGALTGAKQLQLSGGADNQIEQIIAATKSTVINTAGAGGKNISVSVGVIKNDNRVEVVVTDVVETPFLSILGMPSLQKVSAFASARSLGGLPLCVLGLETGDGQVIAATGSAKLTAGGCLVQANSLDPAGMESWGQAQIIAGMICSSGGAQGGSSNYVPSATGDCPSIPDPLETRAAPAFGACDFNKMKIHTPGMVFLTPGVYCGGLKITGNSSVQFAPGVYVIKDGVFEVTGNGKVIGQYVGFYFTGDNAFFKFSAQADVDFSAPKDGPLAGLLVFEDRNMVNSHTFDITSPKVRALVGTIYLPRSEMRVSISGTGYAQAAQESEFTVIVANKLTLNSKSNLVLNTDYAATDVPLPTKIAEFTGRIVISR
jgi:hypothetical protein